MNLGNPEQTNAYKIMLENGYRLGLGFKFVKPNPEHEITTGERVCSLTLMRDYGIGEILCDSHTDAAGEKDMSLHDSTFDYLKPSDAQVNQMAKAREASRIYAQVLNDCLPEGPDKTYALRHLREVAMWANIAITRNQDGTPRIDNPNPPAVFANY